MTEKVITGTILIVLLSRFKNKIMKLNLNENLYLTFRALWHRNYRLFFSGQCISLIGTWIQQIAMSWLIYSLTKSALLMGFITFISFIPGFVVTPFAGVLIDRIDKYRMLIITQILFLIESFVLGILTIYGIIQVWHVIVITVIVGLTGAIDMPLRQSIIVDFIDDNKDIGNAISLNSSIFNLARLIGPAIAGVLISRFNEGVCFLINSLSYIAVIWALFSMKINTKSTEKTTEKNIISELKEGIKYSYNSNPIRNILLQVTIVCLIGMLYPVLMPIFAKEILHGDAQTLGILMSASGAGALFGALYLAAKKSITDLEKWIYRSSLLFGIGSIGLSFTHKALISMATLFIIGFGMVIITSSCNTLLQHFVDNDKRGRVMSLFTMAFIGSVPIGSLFGGAIADKIGVPHTFLLCGLILVIAALTFRTKLKYFKVESEIKEKEPIPTFNN